MTELTTAPSGAPLADGDILLVRKAGEAGTKKLLASEAKEYFAEDAGGGGIEDAPSDGKTYGRKDGDWAEVTGGSDGSGSTRVPHRYWRLALPRHGDYYGYSIATLEFRDTPGGPQRAVGGTPFGDPGYQSGYGVDKAFDGDDSTFWATSFGSNQQYPLMEQYIGYDFGKPIDIQQIMTRARAGTQNEARQLPFSVRVEYSDDGIKYYTAWIYSFPQATVPGMAYVLDRPASSGGGSASAKQYWQPPVPGDFVFDRSANEANNMTLAASDITGLRVDAGPFSGSGDRAKLALRDLPSTTTWQLTVHASQVLIDTKNDYAAFGLTAFESATGKLISVLFSKKDNKGVYCGIDYWGSKGSAYGGTTHIYAVPGGAVNWLQIERDGDNLICRASPNGEDWVVIKSFALTAAFTAAPDKIGFFAGGNNTGGTVSAMGIAASIDVWNLQNAKPYAALPTRGSAGGSGGGSSSGATIVQSAAMRKGGALTLPAAPKAGNHIVLVWTGFPNNQQQPPGFNKLDQIQSNNNNGVAIYVRKYSDGDPTVWNVGQTSDSGWAIFEVAKLKNIVRNSVFAGALGLNGNAFSIALPLTGDGIYLFAFEQDNAENFVLDAKAGLVIDAVLTAASGENHSGTVGHLTSDWASLAITGTLANPLAPVFGAWNLT